MYSLFHLYLEQRIENELTSEQLVNQKRIIEQLEIITQEQQMNIVSKALRFLKSNKVTRAIKKDFSQLVEDFGNWLIIDGSDELYDYYETHIRLPII